MKQLQLDDTTLTLTDLTPADPTVPLTFVGCSADTTGVVINNVVVDRFDDKPCFARVTGTVSVPIVVNFTDANGVAGAGSGTITVPIDVVLYVPQPSVVPYQITAFANAIF